jgi:ribosome maturation protein SDO1
MSKEQIVLEILNKGEIQVSELEREDQLESLRKDIANIIVSKCINSKDGTQFPVSIILKAMNEANCNINPTQNSKKQALEFIKELQKVIPIERSRMKIKVTFDNQLQREKLEEALSSGHTPGEDFSIEKVSERFMELTIQPHLFRDINMVVKNDKELFTNVSIEIQDA